MKDKKYYSLYSDLKGKILSGDYPAGAKLPSKRIMSDKSGYSLITVERAYAMLEDEGYISSIPKKGIYVTFSDAIEQKSITTEQKTDDPAAKAIKALFDQGYSKEQLLKAIEEVYHD